MHLIEILDRGALVNPDGVAFTDPAGAHTLTYAETQDLTHRIAAGLQSKGLSGAPVGILSTNTIYAFPYVLGAVRAGSIWVGINARSSVSELAAFLSRVGTRALIVDPGLEQLGRQVQEQVDSVDHLLPIGEPAGPVPGWLAPSGTVVPLPPLNPEATATLFSTGGTTGAPKAVQVPHRALETMTLAMTTHMPEEAPVHLVAAPLTHAAGALVLPVLLTGGTNIVHPVADPDAILTSIERNRVTRIFLPPTAVYALLEHPKVGDVDLSSLKYFIYGAAPMSVAKLRQAIEVFGPVMTQFYGQVELPMMCTFFGPDEHRQAVEDPRRAGRLASCGRASVVANVAVMDDDGHLVQPGVEGEVVVRSSLRMTGYFGEDTQLGSPEQADGWQRTGDIGVLDEDGYLYLRDRKRDLIISGGFNVFPIEVEQVLWEHPAVLDCAVIGVPDEKWGEKVTAVVELKPGMSAAEAELIAWCRDRLSGVKTPKAVILAQLPRSSVGKVLKRELRERYWAGQDRRI